MAEFLTKSSPAIQSTVSGVGNIITAIDPALKPIVTEFDQLEEQVIGTLLQLANDTASANSLAALFGQAWPVIVSLKQQLSTHPAVQAATTVAKTS